MDLAAEHRWGCLSRCFLTRGERRHDETLALREREREEKNIDIIRADTTAQTNKLKICGVSVLECVLSIPGGMKELILGENRFRGKLQGRARRTDLQREIGKFTGSKLDAPVTQCGTWASVKHGASPQTVDLTITTASLSDLFIFLSLWQSAFTPNHTSHFDKSRQTAERSEWQVTANEWETLRFRCSVGHLPPTRKATAKCCNFTSSTKCISCFCSRGKKGERLYPRCEWQSLAWLLQLLLMTTEILSDTLLVRGDKSAWRRKPLH